MNSSLSSPKVITKFFPKFYMSICILHDIFFLLNYMIDAFLPIISSCIPWSSSFPQIFFSLVYQILFVNCYTFYVDDLTNWIVSVLCTPILVTLQKHVLFVHSWVWSFGYPSHASQIFYFCSFFLLFCSLVITHASHLYVSTGLYTVIQMLNFVLLETFFAYEIMPHHKVGPNCIFNSLFISISCFPLSSTVALRY